ncbi:ADP-dependent glucokinase-like [Rhagoletis pomonella]|uniref:ADP-dependent glucokinase-like n=1 Tax=Rhagoletis pomonella TaxID=28610 RepID=UPI00177FD7AC|nr:ADP-dependent glucokinase-like [Rhagoletis pomonella]XP_036326844.1 ADP-dependent glucokinase-like [Rhagoletis pomonella]XP_036326845.1 ADP-dependent glucokinase-like [Rhagoletis pomonella]
MTSVIKYMSLLTTCSVFAALISIVWQAFLSLKQLNKITTILTGLLAIESSLKRPLQAPKVAVGYGACTDLLLHATEFLNYTNDLVKGIGPEFTVNEVNDKQELLQTFAYYFQNGAAAERIMPNSELFRELIQIAKSRHRNGIQWFLGGNAPLMGTRFHLEGANVLLGARMSRKLRRLVPADIKIAGDEIPEDDIHLILEYKSGDTWGPFKAPRANRYILHSDQNNPHLNSVEHFDAALRSFQPRLLVISGLQMMDSYRFIPGVREARLLKVQDQITSQAPTTLQHFEMASYVEIELLQLLRQYVLPYVDSLGMNEQELENLRQVLTHGRTTLATDWNPRVATALDQMRSVFQILAQDYFRNVTGLSHRRLLTRIHVHTLAYQALLTVRDSRWERTQLAAAKAALTAHRHVCQTDMINPEAASLVLDDSFATTAKDKDAARRIQFSPQQPVPCWNETIAVNQQKSLPIEICVAPVLVCRVAKKTAGAGDNISAAALSQQL